jgi:hypothetical protein
MMVVAPNLAAVNKIREPFSAVWASILCSVCDLHLPTAARQPTVALCVACGQCRAVQHLRRKVSPVQLPVVEGKSETTAASPFFKDSTIVGCAFTRTANSIVKR